MASHPLVAHRIQALEESGLPGAPQSWSVLRATADVDAATRMSLRSKWGRELVVAYGPWALFALVVLFGLFTHSTTAVGLALAVGGCGLLYKQLVRYPMHADRPQVEITSLLDRLDAGPVAGIPVEVRGRVIGRGTPGYLLSPDMVVQDQSGFVPSYGASPSPSPGPGSG